MTGAITTIYPQEQVKENVSHKYCQRCGKELINPKYRELGYGPICYKKMQQKKYKKLF